MRSIQHFRRDSYWQEDEDRERQGPLNFFFPLRGGKKIWDKRREEPIHDSFTLLDEKNLEKCEGKEKVERKREAGKGLNMEAACSGPGVRLDTLGS